MRFRNVIGGGWILVGSLMSGLLFAQGDPLPAEDVSERDSGLSIELPDFSFLNEREDALVPILRTLVIQPVDVVERRELPPDLSGMVIISGLPILNTPSFRRTARGYLGRPLSEGDLDRLIEEIVWTYRINRRPVIDVIVPDLDVPEGRLILEVREHTVGQVRVSGSRWFRRSIIAQKTRFVRGDEIDSVMLQEDLDWMNRNPFRKVGLAYVPGNEPGETDLLFEVEERFPFRMYGGFQNTGNEITGEERFIAGINWGHVFALDHELNYEFRTGRYVDRLYGHSASYVIPLPFRHELTLLGDYAETDIEIEGEDVKGESLEAGVRYTIFMVGWENPQFGLRFSQDFSLGADFKRADNAFELGQARVFDPATEIIQGVGRYDARLRDPFGTTVFNANLFFSPGNFVSRRNRDHVFAEARPGASSQYYYTRLGIEREMSLVGGVEMGVRGVHQHSNRNLLPSEQLGVGGHSSVRGYEERAASGDLGYVLSAELRTPEFNFSEITGLGRPGRDRWQLLGFVDYGMAQIKDREFEEPGRTHLMGAGPGLRMRIADHFLLRFDYGWQIRDNAIENDSRDHRAHAALILSY